MEISANAPAYPSKHRCTPRRGKTIHYASQGTLNEGRKAKKREKFLAKKANKIALKNASKNQQICHGSEN